MWICHKSDEWTKKSHFLFYVSFILCNDVKWSFSLRRPSKVLNKKTHRLNFPFSVTPDNAAEHSTENGFLQWLPGYVCSVNAKHGSRKCSRDDTHHNPIIHFFLPMSVPPPTIPLHHHYFVVVDIYDEMSFEVLE